MPPSSQMRLTNREWQCVKEWLRGLGYTSDASNQYHWVHPHWNNKEIPAIPLQHIDDPMPCHTRGPTFDPANDVRDVVLSVRNGKGQFVSHETVQSGYGNLSDEERDEMINKILEPTIAPALEIGEDETIIPEHTRAGGAVVVKEHIRNKPGPRVKKPEGMSEQEFAERLADRNKRYKTAHTKETVELENPDDGRGRVKTVRITVPKGVKVLIDYE